MTGRLVRLTASPLISERAPARLEAQAQVAGLQPDPSAYLAKSSSALEGPTLDAKRNFSTASGPSRLPPARTMASPCRSATARSTASDSSASSLPLARSNVVMVMLMPSSGLADRDRLAVMLPQDRAQGRDAVVGEGRSRPRRDSACAGRPLGHCDSGTRSITPE